MEATVISIKEGQDEMLTLLKAQNGRVRAVEIEQAETRGALKVVRTFASVAGLPGIGALIWLALKQFGG